ncbi:hypothetical protein M9Y10_032910 [Tritrichomonas musculus]|uniref:Protein kinase domain-containing protein n=1 Tax=Tritrichomonas musculus TaxID=1915356 RepID=A0ABR2GY34_9EUKA
MGNQLTVPAGSSWYLDDFNANHLKNPISIFDGTFSLSFRAEDNKQYYAVKAIQLSGKYDRSIAKTFCDIYDEKSKIISQTKSGNFISTPILTKNGAYLKRPFIDMPLPERIVIDPPLQYIEKKWIAFQLLYAIRNLHKINIFHGDIKPENVLVAPNLNVYLTDHAPFKPQYISQTQPHYFIHFFSYGRPCAYIAPERISRDLSTNPELQKEQTNRAMLAIKAITSSLHQNPARTNQKSQDNKTPQSSQTNSDYDINRPPNNEPSQINTDRTKIDDHDHNQTRNTTDNSQTFSNNDEIKHNDELSQAMEALRAMQAADLFSIGCVLAFIFTRESLFDFSSLIQYGHHNDDSHLKILDKITDDSIKDLIIKLIDRDQKKRLEAINNFEESFPTWMNDFYCFYYDNIIDANPSHIPSILSSSQMMKIFPDTIHDDIIIYLNILSEYFSKEQKISKLMFFIQIFEKYSFYVTSPSLKIVRLIPPLLFLLFRESPTILALAIDSILNIVRSIDNIDDEEDIVKCFSDVYFIPQLLKVMDPKNNRQSNEKLVIISRIPVILVEFQRLWPTILEKLPMRTEFIIPMLQMVSRDGQIDEGKLMIVRYFLSSARTVTYTKSYPVFKALYMILFQMLNCTAYVPLIVEFVMDFLKELNHGDKIRFYSELFPPFQGILLSYVLNFSKSGTADDILVIFDAFTTMVENGEIKITNCSSIANAVYKHITSFDTPARVSARILLKKLPKIYQEFDILSLVTPQLAQTQVQSQQPALQAQQSQQQQQQVQLSQQQMQSKTQSNFQNLSKSQAPHRLVPKSELPPPRGKRASKNSISISGQKKKRQRGNAATSMEDAGDNESNDTGNANDIGNALSNASAASSPNVTSIVKSTSNSSLSGNAPMISSTSVPSMTPSGNTAGLIQDVDLQHTTRRSRSSSFQNQVKTNLFCSTKIASSGIQKILIVRNKNDDNMKCYVVHSGSTVACYTLNISSNNKFNYPLFENKTMEISWTKNYLKPVISIDSYIDTDNSKGLIITLPDAVIKRSNDQVRPIYRPKNILSICKMVNGTTMATVIKDSVVCCDITKNFSIKGSYKLAPETVVKSIYSWESMEDNFFAFSTLNGRLCAIDQRTDVPIFTTAEYPGMSHVILLPHLAYAFAKGGRDLSLYRYSFPYQNEESQICGGYSPKPTYEVKGNVDSVMSISNYILILNQYGTFMLDNLGICMSLSDKNRATYLRPNNDSIRGRQNLTQNASQTAFPGFNPLSSEMIQLSTSGKHRTFSYYDAGQMSKSDNFANIYNANNLKTPVVELPVINKDTLHGHTFPVTACANFNSGAICISGDSAGYINIWSAIHPRSENV